MQVIDRNSPLWDYFSEDLKGLFMDGEQLIECANELSHKITDYSYLVFPFSKAYEGYLKRLFLDLKLIKDDEYYGDDIRIGRILNPRFIQEHENIFSKLVTKNGTGEDLAQALWDMWKEGRNQVFHYFPHNFRRLSYEEAVDVIKKLVLVMDSSLNLTYVREK